MTPFLADQDFTLYVCDVREVLAGLPDASVDCVVTSPPYWGLRDYGTGSWVGGSEDCDHLGEPFRTKSKLNENWGAGYSDVKNAEDRQPMGLTCSKCGAQRQDRQLGLEPTPDAYVENMVAVFREVRRVLADHGTCWVNLGDSYAGSWGNQGRKEERGSQRPINGPMLQQLDGRYPQKESNTGAVPAGLKPKDLVGIPWRVAFALQADGWYLRADIIWAKPNPMPESVTDRPTKAHEYVFLLSKRPRYWFDAEAVREPHADTPWTRRGAADGQAVHAGAVRGQEEGLATGRPTFAAAVREYNPAGRNVRSVWQIATQPYPEAHFATYPEELVRRCLLAGCPEQVCGTCGKPRERIVAETAEYAAWKARENGWATRSGDLDRGRGTAGSGTNSAIVPPKLTHLGWSDCGHGAYRPGVVLDPFLGSGTTALVARKHGRHTVGIELNPAYAELAAKRTRQLSLLAEEMSA